MNKIILTFALTLSLGTLSACAHTQANTAPSMTIAKAKSASASFDVNTVSCWDVLTIKEEDLNMAMMLLYGYTQGENASTTQSSALIETAFMSAFAFCETNPDTPAINGFR